MRLIALVVAAAIALVTGVAHVGGLADVRALVARWSTARPRGAAGATDPIFGRPLVFYLFTLPVWQLVAGWLMTLASCPWRVAAVLRDARRRPAGADGRRRATLRRCAAWR